MSAVKIVNFRKGIVANAIYSILSKQLADGKLGEVVSIKEVANNLNVTEGQVQQALWDLQMAGWIRRESLEPWENVSEFCVSQPSLLVAVGQISMPSGEEPEDHPFLEDILDGNPITFECGFANIPIGDGDETISPPNRIRAAIVDGDKPGTVLLSVVKQLHPEEIELQIGEDRSFDIEGESGRWIDLVDKKQFSDTDADVNVPGSEMTSAWDNAVNWLEEYLIGLNPSEAQCKRLGIELPTVSEETLSEPEEEQPSEDAG